MKRRHTKISLIKSLIIGLLLGIGLLVTPAAHAVDTGYGCGTYGGGGYDDECAAQPPDDDDDDDGNPDTPTDDDDSVVPDSNTDGTPPATEEPDETDPEEPAENERIVLNDYSRYASGVGQSFSLAVGQTIYFMIDGEEHSVTVKEITDEYVVVTIASDPVDVTVNRDETVRHDVNEDGEDDLEIAYTGKSGDKAILSFAQVNPVDESTTPNSTTDSPMNWWWLWVLLGVGGLGLIIWAIVARLRRA